MEAGMDTYFASPGKTNDRELATEIEIISNNPVMSGLLQSISGLLAILDENRQIVAVNDSFIQMLGIKDQEKILGLRPGNVLQCIHSEDEPAGCGTTKFCSTCGAAIAIVSSLKKNTPSERICAVTANRGGQEIDIALIVKSNLIILDGKRYVLLFLQDVTKQQQRAALERTFFHDINNMLAILLGTSELLVDEGLSEYSRDIYQASIRLMKEVAIQQCLSQGDSCDYLPAWHEFTSDQIVEEIILFFKNHPTARDKNLDILKNYPTISIKIDISLLLRVLCNMIINALEATEKKGTVKVWLEQDSNFIIFCVWNAQEIPQDIANRIFSRNFSTKKQDGRGVGTFSMKLFGEKLLGGKISFSTSEKDGTTFKFSYPV
jgi:K+-sensing histidine kinase KdpD